MVVLEAVAAAAIRRRVVSCEFAQNPTAVRVGMDLTQTRADRGLTRKWSPEQISARLVVSHPDDPAVRVSHERIYQTFYCRPAVSCDPS